MSRSGPFADFSQSSRAANDLSGGPSALAEQDTKALISKTYPRANPRALFTAALAGSAMGLGLAAAYLAGANSMSGLTHVRARQMASAEGFGFTDVALQRAGAMDAGALAIAQRHDPFIISGAAQRDRQSADFAARLDSAASTPAGLTAVSLMLRPDLGPDGDTVAGRLRFASIGALDGARDLDCLTQAVYYEARGETPKGQAAVAQVVLNRVRHPAFPKTICAVVFQGAGKRKTDCQFSFVCDGSMRLDRDDEAWDKAQHVAARALSGVTVADIGAPPTSTPRASPTSGATAWSRWPRLACTSSTASGTSIRTSRPRCSRPRPTPRRCAKQPI